MATLIIRLESMCNAWQPKRFAYTVRHAPRLRSHNTPKPTTMTMLWIVFIQSKVTLYWPREGSAYIHGSTTKAYRKIHQARRSNKSIETGRSSTECRTRRQASRTCCGASGEFLHSAAAPHLPVEARGTVQYSRT